MVRGPLSDHVWASLAMLSAESSNGERIGTRGVELSYHLLFPWSAEVTDRMMAIFT